MSLSRRRLLASTATFALGSSVLSACMAQQTAQSGRLPAIQLWSVRHEIEADAAATVAAIANMGYKVVETAGFGKLNASQFRQALDTNGLSCISAHQSFDPDHLQSTFDDANTVGARYTTSGLLRPGTGAPSVPEGSNNGFMATLRAMTEDDAKITAALCNRIGEAARREGLHYVYHNHFFEFVALATGGTGFDILLAETDPDLVSFEMDCGWTAVSHIDPVPYFRSQAARFPLVHIKDFKPAASAQTRPAQRQSTELGQGVIDYAPVIAAAGAAGVGHFIVEQEDPFTGPTPLEAARLNFATARRWLA